MENFHLGVKGEDETLSYAGVGTEHLPLLVLHHQDGGAPVTDLLRHLLQRPRILLSGEEEPPVISNLRLEVVVDEVKVIFVKRGAVGLKYKIRNKYTFVTRQSSPP